MYHYYMRVTAQNKYTGETVLIFGEYVTDKPITSFDDILKYREVVKSRPEMKGFNVIVDFFTLLRKDDD